jgi:hypothetical protein
MTNETLNTIAACAGPLITLLGFLFLRSQLKGEREALETQTASQIYGVGSGILQLFVNHPDCRPFIYENAPLPPREPQRSKVLAVTEIVCDHLENIVLHAQATDSRTIDVWTAYMRGLYARSAVMRDFLLPENEGYRYSPRLLETLRGAGVPADPSA